MNKLSAKTYEFSWSGTNKQGKTVSGILTAVSSAMLRAELRRQGINPTKVQKKATSLFGNRKKSISSRDITQLTRQLSTMLSSGIPLVQAFDIVGRGHENPTAQTLMQDIKTSIESGSSFNETLKKYPKYFNKLFVSLIEAGEQSGCLDTMLNRLATYKEKTESLKGKVKKALVYPAAVLIVAFVISVGLLIFVVPQFESLFKGFGADLPAMTQLVVTMSKFMQAWWWLIIGGLTGGIWGTVAFWRRSEKFQYTIDRMSLKIPIIGNILRQAIIARFSRTLSITFAAGLPLVDSLIAVAGVCGNKLYYDATLRIREEVSAGQQLQFAMRSTNLFPNMTIQMVAVGEEAGSLESMLSKVADFYEEAVDNAVNSLSSLLEPFIMVILGVIVGGLVVAMYLPIFKLGSVV